MNALLVIGSPKGRKSVSCALGRALTGRLAARGAAVEEITVAEALHAPEALERLVRSADAADLVVVSFPLYVDQLPAPLIRVLEAVAERRRARGSGSGRRAGQRLVAVVQCGFWETHQNRPAADVMRQFARETGFVWAGGLIMGAGGALSGRDLEKSGGLVRNIVKALDLAAASLATGGLVPEEAEALMAKPLMPRWLYHLAANWGFRSLIRKHGARRRTYDRPFA